MPFEKCVRLKVFTDIHSCSWQWGICEFYTIACDFFF